jgi:hypothetical protein
VLFYFTATGLLVAMSRFQVPMIPFLIVLAAGLLARGIEPSARNAATLAQVGTAIAVLLFLWWVDLPEVRALLELAWEARS